MHFTLQFSEAIPAEPKILQFVVVVVMLIYTIILNTQFRLISYLDLGCK